MRTPSPDVPPIRLVSGSPRGDVADARGAPGGAGALPRAAHRDDVRARLSSGTYDTSAAAHALACVLLARGEL